MAMRGGQWGVALSHLTPAIPQSHPAEPGYAASLSPHCGQVAMRQALLGLGHLHAQDVIHKARPGGRARVSHGPRLRPRARV